MSDEKSTQVQRLLDRLRQGDDSARQELIAHAYERLRLLARKILHEDFPRLEGLHETGSILHEAALRLLKALQSMQPANPRAFFAHASLQIRRVLVDLARRHDRRTAPLQPIHGRPPAGRRNARASGSG